MGILSARDKAKYGASSSGTTFLAFSIKELYSSLGIILIRSSKNASNSSASSLLIPMRLLKAVSFFYESVYFQSKIFRCKKFNVLVKDKFSCIGGF